MRVLGNILWIILGGLAIAIGWALVGLILCISIIGIPFGIQAFKMAGLTLTPFGKTVQYAQILETLLDKYRKLGELQTYAFNLDLNIQLRFAASVDLARFIGVSETEILHNEAEIDDFFL